MATLTVGKFSQKGDDLEGPAAYLNERGNDPVDKILSGQDTMFNLTANLSPSVEMVVLVRLQTDYAVWLGQQQLLAALR